MSSVLQAGFPEWRPSITAKGYSVSSEGDIRNDRTGRVLNPAKNNRGYRKITLRIGGNETSRNVGDLVCEMFHGERKPGMEVNHKDGVKDHDAAHNLEWVTGSENMKHAVANGLTNRKVKGRLTREQVVEIWGLKDKMGHAEIAALYGVHMTTVQSIFKERSWKGTRPKGKRFRADGRSFRPRKGNRKATAEPAPRQRKAS